MVLFSHAANCRRLRIKPIRTRVYTPSTNGKAESLVQPTIREWAYARPYQNSAERISHLGASQPPGDSDTSAQRAPTSRSPLPELRGAFSHLATCIHQQNGRRPHASLNQRPSISRSRSNANNLLRHHSKAKQPPQHTPAQKSAPHVTRRLPAAQASPIPPKNHITPQASRKVPTPPTPTT